MLRELSVSSIHIRRLFAAAKLLALAGLLVFSASPRADLRAPAWYDQNSVGVAPDWHYRVPINVPAGAAINSTIKLDVDFAALLNQLGVSGAFDSNSPRIVRSNGALATIQEFTDAVYAGTTDATGNSRGEVRFILEDAGATTYYLYFDITANGLKPTNPQTPINGNFEVGGTGTSTPPGWNVAATAGFDAQIRPSESPSISTDGTVVGNGAQPRTTDGTPRTGAYSYLLGARSANEPGTTTAPAVTLSRTITVPTSSPGSLTVRYRVEGWDSSSNSSSSYDYIRIALVGGSNNEIVGPAAGNYTTLPFSPNLGTNQASNTQSGYGQYNGWDTSTNGTHRSGMSLARGSEPWFTATANLSAYAGQTITLRISTNHVNVYRTWFHIDDVEWSVVTATLGTPEGFGVNITTPTATTTYSAGQKLVIRAAVDASPTAASNPVTANVYDNSGTLVMSGVRLYNDGTHGDATANDEIWTNDGSVVADPTYTFTGSSSSGNNWKVRVFAKDASTSAIGASNGLVHIPSQANTPETQANFYNVDEQTFIVQTPSLLVLKSVQVVSDPVNGGANPKSIPGATELFALRVTNQGSGGLDNNSVSVTDPIPNGTKLYVNDASGPGSGPIVFTNGSPSSGLTWTFTALNSTTDDLDFSNDGGTTWTYAPTVDADGCDAAVTHIRMKPKGTMPGNAGGNPYFELRFRVRVK